MSSIDVRKDGNQRTMAAPAPATPWEPGRILARLMGADPFRELAPFFGSERSVFEPAFEVKETKDSYLVRADVPGIKGDDLDVSVLGNRLTVSGKRDAEKEEKGDAYYTYERSFGSFRRSFTLPEGIDASSVHADLSDGVLTIVLPKTEEAQPQRIPVKSPKRS